MSTVQIYELSDSKSPWGQLIELNSFLVIFRSVQPAQRSLALGFQTMLIRALGTVPGPIVYGAVIDSTCILWQGQEEGGDISCRVFDNTSTSRHLLVSLLK